MAYERRSPTLWSEGWVKSEAARTFGVGFSILRCYVKMLEERDSLAAQEEARQASPMTTLAASYSRLT